MNLVKKFFKSENAETCLILSIYFLSGICSLIDEVIWVRLLKLILGNTVYASSVVVSTFMGGLALGALIMSRFADRIQKRLRLYVVLEFLITLSALAFPVMLQLSEQLYRWFFRQYHPSFEGLLVVQVLLSAVLLLIPTMLMGSTLPLLSRQITARKEKIGQLVGKLYMLNTLGAALGCFLAGFVLVPQVGVWGTLFIAAGINMIVALSGWSLSRRYDNISVQKPLPDSTEAGSSVPKAALPINTVLLLLGFFCSGFISIGYEMIWMRSIVFLLGGPTYVFAAVLTIYLLGNVIGVWISSRMTQKVIQPALAFGVSLLGLGITGVTFLFWLLWLRAGLFTMIIEKLPVLLTMENVQAMGIPLFISATLFIIPSIIMGIGFPLALQAWGRYIHQVGKTTGLVYGINTIGCVFGGIVAGFIFIPWLGVQASIVILGFVGLIIGLSLILVHGAETALYKRLLAIIVAVACILLPLLTPTDLFTKKLVEEAFANTQLIDVKEGTTTTVSVHKTRAGNLIIATSGIQVAGDRDGFRITQKFLGHVGPLINKNAQKILSIGFGSGESSTCLTKHQPELVEVVEISPEVVDVSLRNFTHINLGAATADKVKITFMDAKNYLNLTNNRYDLILTDSINPKRVAENASLYSREYFQSACNCLEKNGLVGCWLPIEELPVSCVNSILGTFAEVFPYITLWFPVTALAQYDFIFLVGSREPQTFSPQHIETALQSPEISNSVEYINFVNSRYIASCYMGDEDDLKKHYLSGYQVNSDYQPFIEFNTDFTENILQKKRWTKEFVADIRRNSFLKHIDWSGMNGDEQQKWLDDYNKMYAVSDYLLQARFEKNLLSVLYLCSQGLKEYPGQAALLQQQDMALDYLWSNLNENKLDVDAAVIDADKLLYLDEKLGAAWLVKSWIAVLKKDTEKAMQYAQKAILNAPEIAHVQRNFGFLLLTQDETAKATGFLSKAVAIKPDNARFRIDLGSAFIKQKSYDKAIPEFQQAVKLAPDDPQTHFILANLYRAQGMKQEAVQEYKESLEIDPNFTAAQQALDSL